MKERLFHVSEEPGIEKFSPRMPHRTDVGPNPLVWALNERCLPNFLTPRDCPRVTYHASEKTTEEDILRFFSSNLRHCVAIEHCWHDKILTTPLYIYEFDSSNFRLQDEVAGYYVSETTEFPINVIRYNNLYEELFSRGVEVRVLDRLWNLAYAVQQSTLNWSLCRMFNAIAEEIR